MYVHLITENVHILPCEQFWAFMFYLLFLEPIYNKQGKKSLGRFRNPVQWPNTASIMSPLLLGKAHIWPCLMPGPFLLYLICFENLYIKAGGGCKSLERARNPARLAHQGLSCVSVIAKGHVWHCEQPRDLHFFCSQTCTLWSMSKRLWPCRNLACLLTKGQILWPHSCFTRGRKFNIFINFHRYKNTRMLPFFLDIL